MVERGQPKCKAEDKSLFYTGIFLRPKTVSAIQEIARSNPQFTVARSQIHPDGQCEVVVKRRDPSVSTGTIMEFLKKCRDLVKENKLADHKGKPDVITAVDLSDDSFSTKSSAQLGQRIIKFKSNSSPLSSCSDGNNTIVSPTSDESSRMVTLKRTASSSTFAPPTKSRKLDLINGFSNSTKPQNTLPFSSPSVSESHIPLLRVTEDVRSGKKCKEIVSEHNPWTQPSKFPLSNISKILGAKESTGEGEQSTACDRKVDEISVSDVSIEIVDDRGSSCSQSVQMDSVPIIPQKTDKNRAKKIILGTQAFDFASSSVDKTSSVIKHANNLKQMSTQSSPGMGVEDEIIIEKEIRNSKNTSVQIVDDSDDDISICNVVKGVVETASVEKKKKKKKKKKAPGQHHPKWNALKATLPGPNFIPLSSGLPRQSEYKRTQFGPESNKSEVSTGSKKKQLDFGGNIINPTSGEQKTGLRPVIIDGSNVAIGHGKNKFSVQGLTICIKYFIDKGHKVIAFVPKFRRFQVSEQERKVLDDLEKFGSVSFTPSRTMSDGRRIISYDDRFIVQTAVELGGVIVSTDNYRDLLEENSDWRETIEKRLLMFTWVGDMLLFPNDPLGRDGPHLQDFLRFPDEQKTS